MHPKKWNVTSSKFSYKSHHNSKKIIWSTHTPNNFQTVHIWELIPYTALLIQPLPASVSQAGLSLNKPNAGASECLSSRAYPDLSIKDRVPASVSQAASTRPIHIQYHTPHARTLLQIIINNNHGTSSIKNAL